MELKLRCHCGQKFKFGVEPINGQMPFQVQCPACGADGTSTANAVLAQMFAPATPQAASASVAASQPPPITLHAPVVSAPLSPLPAMPRYVPPVSSPPRERGQGNIFLGIAGAVLGAAAGIGVMFGYMAFTGFGLPILSITIGLLAGVGARVMYKGTDSSLGFMAAAITFLATGGCLFFMFGIFAIVNVISLMVSVSTAWKIASG